MLSDRPSPLRLVVSPQRGSLRAVCIASWRAARINSRAGALTLTAASGAGMLLAVFGDARKALAAAEGSDDWAVLVRSHLHRVLTEEDSNEKARRAEKG